jgi:hypothetical protein
LAHSGSAARPARERDGVKVLQPSEIVPLDESDEF